MRVAAQKAIHLDNSLSDAYSLLGFYYFRYGGDAEQAIINAEQSVSLSPSSAHHYHIASLIFTWMGGQPKRGLALIQKAFQLNPFPPALYFDTLGSAYFGLGQYDDAIDAFQENLHRAPDFIPAHVSLTAIYTEIGQGDKAQEHAQEILRVNPKFSVDRWTAHYHSSVKESFRGLLRQAGLPE